MTAPTDNAALRAAREIAASLHPQSPWSRDILAGKLDNDDAVRAALAAAIPPEQDGYAEGRAREVLDEADHAGILLRAAEQTEIAARIQRTAMADGLSTDDASFAEWSEKKARTFRHAAAVLTTDRHAEGRIAGLEEAAKVLRARADEEDELCAYLALDAAETAIRTIANGGTAA